MYGFHCERYTVNNLCVLGALYTGLICTQNILCRGCARQNVFTPYLYGCEFSASETFVPLGIILTDSIQDSGDRMIQ